MNSNYSFYGVCLALWQEKFCEWRIIYYKTK